MIHSNADTPGSRDCGRFFLDVVGRFAPEQMNVRWTGDPRTSNEEVDALIEQTWDREKTLADQAKRRLFNGSLCRLVQASPSPDQLSLTLGAVSYKEFVGTNLTNAYLRHIHGPDVLADALGVSAAVVSADGFLVLGRRSKKVAYHGGRIHPIGGIVEPAEAGQPAPHPAETMTNELREELCITPEQIDAIECIALVRDKHIVQPELVFDVTVSADVAEMITGAREAKDSMEHAEIVPVRHHPASVVTFMENHAAQLTPVALATLLVHGLHVWGSGWFASTRGYLRSWF
jgi:hypothetical protein